MARVIKGGQGDKRKAPRANPARIAAGRKVIDKDVYRAQQEASELIAVAEAQRDEIVGEGKRRAAKAREEASTLAAEEAFAKAAQEAILAFRRRAERYLEAADDIRTLAHEVARKIVGAELQLSAAAIDALVAEGMQKLRARRKLRVQIPQARFKALNRERPILMRALEAEPDLLVEGNDDVSEGFARVVLEVGGALCAEQDALDSLAEAIGVDETAVAPDPHASGLFDRQALGLEDLDGDDVNHEGPDRNGFDRDDVEDAARENTNRNQATFTDSDERENTEWLARARPAEIERGRGHLAETSTTGVVDPNETGEDESSEPDSAPMSEPPQNQGRQRRRAPEEDVERTMALDVSELREEMDTNRGKKRRTRRSPERGSERARPKEEKREPAVEDDFDDDLDLFADPSVPS